MNLYQTQSKNRARRGRGSESLELKEAHHVYKPQPLPLRTQTPTSLSEPHPRQSRNASRSLRTGRSGPLPKSGSPCEPPRQPIPETSPAPCAPKPARPWRMRPGAQRPLPGALAPQPPCLPTVVSRPFLLLSSSPASPFTHSPAGPTSPHRGPAPRTCGSPGSPFASACREESRPTPVTGPAPRHELQRFRPPASNCGCAHWTAVFSVKRGGSDDWILWKTSEGYWWREERGRASCLRLIGQSKSRRPEWAGLALASALSRDRP